MFTCTHACPHRRSLPFAHFARGTGTTSPVLGEGRRESGCLEPAPRWVPIFLNSKPPTPWTPPSSPQPMPPHSDAQAARGASSIWGSSQAGRPGGREPPSLETRPQVSGTRAGAAGGGGKQPEGLEIPSHHQRKAAGTHPTPTPSTPPSSLSVVPTGVRRQGVWDLGGALGGEGASADREGPQRILYTGTMQSVSVCPRA